MSMVAETQTDLPMTPTLAALFQRLLGEFEGRDSIEWDQGTTALDAAVYTDPAIYRKEMDRIFRKVPICLGHEDQLREPGSVIARNLFGLPLLITRDRQGQINVLLNVCRHRGARLVAGENEVCRKGAISCPYHAWTYDLNGSLRALPGSEAFPDLDKEERALRRLPSEVRHGLIWAIMDPQATDIDVAGFLGGIDEDIAAMNLAPHRFYRQEVRRRKTNWKLVLDAFQEIYHIKRLHSRTIGPFFLDTKSAGESADRHVRFMVARDGMEKVKHKPQSAWDLRRDVTFSHIVFPNNVIIYHPDYTSLLNVYPAGVDESIFVHTMFTPHAPRNEKEARHWERSFAMIDGGVFSEEDLFISEQTQLGLNSGANDSFVLGRFEHQLRWFHENIDKMLHE